MTVFSFSRYPPMLRKLTLVLCGLLALPAVARDVEVGKPAPPLTARTLDGGDFSLQAQRGKVVIVNFWATWCSPCRKEMPALDAYYEKHRGDGLVLLGISMDNPSDRDKVKAVMKAYHFPAAMRDDTDLSGYGRIRLIPQTYIIDRQGMVRRDGEQEKGAIDQAALEHAVDPLLQAAPAPAK